MEVSDLKPALYNPRKITSEKLRMLKKSMEEFGDLSGITFNRQTGRILGGHQRIKHLEPSWKIEKHEVTDQNGTVAAGWVNTPYGRWTYREVDWDEKREMAANIAANKHGGEFDMPLLKELVTEIDDNSMDLELIGFSADELVTLLAHGVWDDKKDIDQKAEEAEALGSPDKKVVHWIWCDMRSQEEMEMVLAAIGSKRREIDPDKLISLLKEAGMWEADREEAG